MNLLANIEELSQEQLDYMQQKIMSRKHDILLKQVEELAEISTRLQVTVNHQNEMIETAVHRIDNLDMTNIEGTPQQRLNKMVRLYAVQNGLQFNNGWKDFTQAYNLAFSTNLTSRHDNYKEKNGKCTLPEYLVATERIEDAVRVADKMLNKRKPLRAVN